MGTEAAREAPVASQPPRRPAFEAREEYRAHIGHVEYFDVLTAIQFNLMTTLGLRDQHTLLDIGCGSLRAGRLFIPYLRRGGYFGIEPLAWLVEEGIRNEVGQDLVRIKEPVFSDDANFTLTTFGRTFDFMIAQSIFSHTSQAQISRCVSQARQCLAPQGLFAATYFESAADYEGDRWVAKADYTRETMRKLVEDEGMAVTFIQWRHPDPQQWMVIHHPGVAVPLGDSGDSERVKMLEEQLATNRQQLLNIRSHPYVRLGLKLQPFLIEVNFVLRRVKRALLSPFGGGNG
jgi:hypothetical protein